MVLVDVVKDADGDLVSAVVGEEKTKQELIDLLESGVQLTFKGQPIHVVNDKDGKYLRTRGNGEKEDNLG